MGRYDGMSREELIEQLEQLRQRLDALQEKASDHSRADKALRESEARYRSLFDDSPISLWEEDFSGALQVIEDAKASGVRDFEDYFARHPHVALECMRRMRIRSVNKATLRLYRAEDEPSFLADLRHVAGKDVGTHIASLVAMAEGRTSFESEAYNWKLDGERMSILLRWVVAPGHEKSYERVLVSVLDLTELERAAEALKDSERKYRSVFENTGTATMIVEEDATISMANAQLAKLSGYSVEEIEGKMSWTDFVFPADLDRLKRFHAERRRENGLAPSDYEFRFVDRHGRLRYVHNKVALVPGTSKSVASMTDITHWKEATEALAQSEERYRSLVENTQDGYFVMSADGRLLFVNQRLCDLWGLEPDEADGLSIWELLQDHEHTAFRRMVRARLARTPASERAQVFRALRKDGSSFLAEVSITPVTFRGEKVLQGLLRDVTEMSRIEEQLRQAQKMEAIGRLSGGIAHDFNNILAGILGHAELSLIELPGPGSVRSHLDQIMKASARARELVRQILAFSRQDSPELRPVHIAPLVEDALRFLRASLPASIEIHSTILAQNDLVEADPTQIHRVLMNLCTNAAQAIEGSHGVVEIRLANAAVRETGPRLHPDLRPGDYLRLDVADSGRGIPAESIRKVFDPYFTTRRRGDGTGLGLSVVHGIVKSYGGEVLVESQVGEGTTFSIFLPLLARKAESEAPHADSVPGGHERVLFVDDEPVLATVGEQMLGRLGYHVETCTDGREALRRFRAEPDRFDLVFTDMTMPGMSGDELSAEILKIRPGIPIVLCTGFSSELSREQARAIGVRELAQKPLGMHDLAITVRKALDG